MQRSALGGLLAALGMAAAAGVVSAESPQDILRALEAEARRVSPDFPGFSAARGERFFKTAPGGQWSCATCHTADPRRPGQHATTTSSIAPLAPAANPERFTKPATVEKWFRRNCNDVLGRRCTALEQGDVLAWLLSLGDAR